MLDGRKDSMPIWDPELAIPITSTLSDSFDRDVGTRWRGVRIPRPGVRPRRTGRGVSSGHLSPRSLVDDAEIDTRVVELPSAQLISSEGPMASSRRSPLFRSHYVCPSEFEFLADHLARTGGIHPPPLLRHRTGVPAKFSDLDSESIHRSTICASPRNMKNPRTSVAVVMKIVADVAGS